MVYKNVIFGPDSVNLQTPKYRLSWCFDNATNKQSVPSFANMTFIDFQLKSVTMLASAHYHSFQFSDPRK